jgi:hypothetical protein
VLSIGAVALSRPIVRPPVLPVVEGFAPGVPAVGVPDEGIPVPAPGVVVVELLMPVAPVLAAGVVGMRPGIAVELPEDEPGVVGRIDWCSPDSRIKKSTGWRPDRSYRLRSGW